MLRIFREQAGELYIAYADIDSTTIFDFRGCMGPSLSEIEKAIITEVQGTIQFDGKSPSELREEIEIYYRDVKEVPRLGISCDAVAIVKKKTINRSPRYIKM